MATISITIGACEKSTALRADHVHARRHHRRRMDQGRDGRRAFHRVRAARRTSGICALFPVAPMNSSRQMADSTPKLHALNRQHAAAASCDGAEVERAEGGVDQEDRRG